MPSAALDTALNSRRDRAENRGEFLKALAGRLGMPVPKTAEQVNTMLGEVDRRMAAAAVARATAAAEAAVAYPAHWVGEARDRCAHINFGVRGAGPGIDYPADWNLDLTVT